MLRDRHLTSTNSWACVTVRRYSIASEVLRRQHIVETYPTQEFSAYPVANHIDNFRSGLRWMVVGQQSCECSPDGPRSMITLGAGFSRSASTWIFWTDQIL